MLSFICTGSAFNTKLGNNSAYVKAGTTLFLIDCGSTTFQRLIDKGILDGVEAYDCIYQDTCKADYEDNV